MAFEADKIKKKPGARPKKAFYTDAGTLTDQEIAFCHMLISGKHTDQKCAEEVGYKKSQAGSIKNRPRVQEYLRIYKQEMAQQMARREIDKLQSFDIDRIALVRHLWRLSNLDPVRTRGTITGQVEAAREVAELLGLKLKAADKLLDSMTDEQLRNYLSYGSPDAPIKN